MSTAHAKPADNKSDNKSADKTVPAQPAKPVKQLTDYDQVIAGAVHMLNEMAKQHNEEVNALRAKSGDRDDAIASIVESSENKELSELRDRITKMQETIEKIQRDMQDIATHEYESDPKYKPLTPEQITAKQEVIKETRTKWTKGFEGLDMMAMLTGTNSDDLAALRENHVTALVKNGRKSHVSSARGETGIKRPRVKNIRIADPSVANGEFKPISEDGNDTFTTLSAKLKDFDIKLGSAELFQLVTKQHGGDFDNAPDIDAEFEIEYPGGKKTVKFDKK